MSEITWLTSSRPRKIEEYWTAEYPQIDTASGKMRVLEEAGYTPAGCFILPPSSWMEGYYRPMEERFGPFLERHRGSKTAEAVVEAHREEIEVFKRYGEYFSYGFYVARKAAV